MEFYHYNHSTVVDSETKRNVRKNSNTIEDYEQRIRELESGLEQMSIVTEALWKLVSEKTGMDESSLNDTVVTLVDAREKEIRAKVTCNRCAQQTPKIKPKCIYCGNTL